MNHKPMLAVACGDRSKLTFPLIASPKLDGVRCIITEAGALARSLKPIPNVQAQELLGRSGLPIGLDGELIAGDPTAKDAYRKTVSMVMSDDKPVDGLVFHVFDIQEERPWEERQAHVIGWFDASEYVSLVPQVTVWSLAELEALEAEWVNAGYEGVILRRPGSPYKHGRSTVKEGYLLKLKRFVDSEAEVIGVTELMHNGNAAKKNELGRTARSHKKEGLTGAGVMGTLVVRDVKTGVEFEIGTGFTAEERASIWKAHTSYIKGEVFGAIYRPEGQLCKYKHFPSGAKDKPRHPVFLGWRDKRDL